ncbi:PEP/pyruvate-binding domain-containing protein [Streptomyces sp. 900105755]
MIRYVYDFTEGGRDKADLLGGKGANLAEMTRLGLPVPQGFTVTTEACRVFLATGSEPDGLAGEITEHLTTLERAAGRRLGRSDDLLLSVRSGARFSMPGMMETILDIGLNDESVLGLAKVSGNERFALGLLPSPRADVRKHRHGGRRRSLRARHGRPQNGTVARRTT